MMFAPTESVKKARTVGHKSKPFQKEEAVITRYFWRGILVVVLGAALVQSAAAQAGIGAAVPTSPGMSHSFEDIAAVLVIVVMYLNELSRILTLCQFAAPVPARSAEATNQSAQPPRHGTPNGATGALRSVAKKTGAEMSLLGTLVSLSRKFE
jgi:hypothetical protein